MTELRFEDPPPRRGGPAPDPIELQIAQQLRSRPNEWAVIEEHASHQDALLLQRRIRRGAAGSAWTGGFEAVVRKTGERQWRVYARSIEYDEVEA
jgi:hypothetical protein